MKKLFSILMSFVFVFACTDVAEVETPVGPYYYAIYNVDLDGVQGDPYVFRASGWESGWDAKSEVLEEEIELLDLLVNSGSGSITHKFNAGCLYFETFVCYDGVAGQKTMTASGGRFGIRIANNCSDPNKFFKLTIDNIDKTIVSTPFVYFTSTTIYYQDYLNYAEPGTGIMWGISYGGQPASANWKLQVEVDGVSYPKGGGTYQTKMNFSNGDNSIIQTNEVCSAFALPIEWVTPPSGKKSGKNNLLTWSVNETEVEKYVIKRSKTGLQDLEEWETVAEIPSKTPSGQKGVNVEYSYLDTKTSVDF